MNKLFKFLAAFVFMAMLSACATSEPVRIKVPDTLQLSDVKVMIGTQAKGEAKLCCIDSDGTQCYAYNCRKNCTCK